MMMDHETFVLDGIMVVGDTEDATELVDCEYDGVWRSSRSRSRLNDVAFVGVGVGNKMWISEHIGVTVHGLDGRGVELLIHDFMMQLLIVMDENSRFSFQNINEELIQIMMDGSGCDSRVNNSLLFIVVAAKKHRERVC